MIRRGYREFAYIPRILARVRPYTGLAVGSVVILVVGALVGLLTPWPLKVLVDSVLGTEPVPSIVRSMFGSLADEKSSLLIVAVLAGLAITIAQNGLIVLNNYLGTRLKERLVLDFRSDLFQHAQRLSLTFHDHQRTGDLMNRVTYQASTVGAVVMAGPPMLQSVVTLFGMFWIAFRIDPTLALISLSVVPFIYYSVGYYAVHVDGRLREVKGMEGQTMSIVHEGMAMLRVIVAFGRESYEHGRFRKQGETALAARVKLTVQQTMFSLIVNTLTAIGAALVLGFGAYQVLQLRLTVGELLVVMAYIASVYTPLEAISTTMGNLKDQLIGAQMAFELLDTAPEIADAPDATAIARAEGRVRFDHVSFAYKGRTQTLQDICFEARPGEVVAIVGPTGAGKSTLASLIPRFYDPSQGRITLDGRQLTGLTLQSLREQISVVLQEPLLFSTTIAENIRYGRLDASDTDVIEAAKAANAHEFVMRLPGQYEARIGERGAQLSGGERQRIAVARAFLKDAPILVLDEPTSSIDSKTEGVILDALDRLVIGRTTFMIAHRLSTIRYADQILVMDRGRIVEIGIHDELLRRDTFFKRMHDAQTRRPRQPGPAPVEEVV